MIILIPTAKQMKKRNEIFDVNLSEKTLEIAKNISELEIENISKIFKLSIEKSEIEKKRFENIGKKNYKALELFDGLMYRNIKRENLSKEEKEYFLKNVYITSALYGIINVYDSISEHRLDFNMPFKINNESLKKVWREEYDKFVKGKEVLSLLSDEFLEVFSKNIRDTFINIEFYELKDGKLKSHSTISKKARGLFLSELVRLNIQDIDKIKNLEFDGFKYSEINSKEREFVFIKGGE